jgi:hypothetical protein
VQVRGHDDDSAKGMERRTVPCLPSQAVNSITMQR